MKTIDGIECFSKTHWYVVFKQRRDKEQAKNSKITLHGKEFTLVSTEIERPTYTWVRLFGYPLDSPADFLQRTMGLYGELVSITDDIDGRLQIKTGIKIAQYKSLKGNIPSFISVGKYRVRTAYRGQIRTCRNCQQTGHEAKDCQAGRVCRECGQPGHTKGSCPERRCYNCEEKGHEANTCPAYLAAFPGLNAQSETDDSTQTSLTDRPNFRWEDDPTEVDHSGWGDPPKTTTPTTSADTQPPTLETATSEPPPSTSPVALATSTTTTPSHVTPTQPSDQGDNDTATPSTMDTQETVEDSHLFKKPDPPHTSMPPDTDPPTESDSTITPGESDSSSPEDEPPLKTQKALTNALADTSHAEETTRKRTTTPANASKQKSPRKKNKQKKRTSVAVSNGKNRNPFTN